MSLNDVIRLCCELRDDIQEIFKTLMFPLLLVTYRSPSLSRASPLGSRRIACWGRTKTLSSRPSGVIDSTPLDSAINMRPDRSEVRPLGSCNFRDPSGWKWNLVSPAECQGLKSNNSSWTIEKELILAYAPA
ncbi:hypothetical protein BsWGS_01019 [Bradybaena similaris]